MMFPVNSLLRSALLPGLLALGGCATLPDNSQRTETRHVTATADTALGQLVEERMPAHAEGQSGYLLLGNGLDAFVARAVLARQAQRSIDTQYYMMHGDEVGTLFAYELLQAANRGVRVRLLLDDIDEGSRDHNIAVYDSHPNIEVRLFNPFARNVGRTSQYLTGLASRPGGPTTSPSPSITRRPSSAGVISAMNISMPTRNSPLPISMYCPSDRWRTRCRAPSTSTGTAR